ncbi:MAG: hypothetical protein ABI333_24745 [bacterium]
MMHHPITMDKLACLVPCLALLGACFGGPKLPEGKGAPALLDSKGQAAQTFDGRPVVLSELLKQGPVMLVFLRGFS